MLDMKAGPDGKMYAVGGHVDIDTSPVKGNPAATIAKMASRSAGRPGSGRSQRAGPPVAAQASQAAAQARAQLAAQRTSGTTGANPAHAGPEQNSRKTTSSSESSISGQLLDVTG